MDDDKLKAAADRTSEALGRIVDSDEVSVLDVDAVCSGLEEIGELVGVESLSTRKLRRSLEKRGLRRR